MKQCCQEINCKCQCSPCYNLRIREMLRNNDPEKMFCAAVCERKDDNLRLKM